MAHQAAGQPGAAEDAYRKSPAISVRLGDVAGQAGTLGQLGNLYDDELNRPEEAVVFTGKPQTSMSKFATRPRKAWRGAISPRPYASSAASTKRGRKSAGQSNAKHNSATRPAWKSWAILADIETDAGNTTAAAEAQRKAIACYLAYRRDGGENY